MKVSLVRILGPGSGLKSKRFCCCNLAQLPLFRGGVCVGSYWIWSCHQPHNAKGEFLKRGNDFIEQGSDGIRNLLSLSLPSCQKNDKIFKHNITSKLFVVFGVAALSNNYANEK